MKKILLILILFNSCSLLDIESVHYRSTTTENYDRTYDVVDVGNSDTDDIDSNVDDREIGRGVQNVSESGGEEREVVQSSNEDDKSDRKIRSNKRRGKENGATGTAKGSTRGCIVPFNKHTGCTKCPLPVNVDPEPDDVRRYLRFGTGRGHTIYTPSHDHIGRFVLLLTDKFGQAEKVWQCGSMGCNKMDLSWSWEDKERKEYGFANDCRQHWRYTGKYSDLVAKVGKHPLYFRVRKNGKDYTISVPRNKSFKDRIE